MTHPQDPPDDEQSLDTPQVDIDVPGLSLATELGPGRAGVVYRAVELATDREVAVRVIDDGDGPDALELLAPDLLALIPVAADHPSLARLVATGRTGQGFAYIVEQLAGETTLEDRLASQGRLPWPAALELVGRAAEGLAAAHLAGVCDGELRPSRIHLGADGEPLVAGVGLGAVTGGPQGSLQRGAAWTAPELFRGGEPTAAADVYSLAAIAVTAITGQPPFGEGVTPGVTLSRMRSQDPPDLRVDGVPEAAATAIADALRPEPEARPEAGALAAVLRGAAGAGQAENGTGATAATGAGAGPGNGTGAGAAGVPTRPARRPRRRVVVAIAALAMLVIAAGAAVAALALSRRSSGQPAAASTPRSTATAIASRPPSGAGGAPGSAPANQAEVCNTARGQPDEPIIQPSLLSLGDLPAGWSAVHCAIQPFADLSFCNDPALIDGPVIGAAPRGGATAEFAGPGDGPGAQDLRHSVMSFDSASAAQRFLDNVTTSTSLCAGGRYQTTFLSDKDGNRFDAAVKLVSGPQLGDGSQRVLQTLTSAAGTRVEVEYVFVRKGRLLLLLSNEADRGGVDQGQVESLAARALAKARPAP